MDFWIMEEIYWDLKDPACKGFLKSVMIKNMYSMSLWTDIEGSLAHD